MPRSIKDGHYAISNGHIATIVTHLEMLRPKVLPKPDLPKGYALTHEVGMSTEAYRSLFKAVGADWLWFSRISMSEADLAAIIHDPQVEVSVMREGDKAIGLLELDFRKAPVAEIAFFGLVDGHVGKGLGKTLMQAAIASAFGGTRLTKKLTVHTCTLDHPSALGFYRAAGFTPVRQEVEIAPDPRLDGRLPETAGRHIPLFRPSY
jgi:GNAT superfamily N-acetyltransferase